MIDVSHWLGALITSGGDHRHARASRPVRALVHAAAAALLPCRRAAVTVTVASGTHDVHTVAVSEPPEQAWAAAAAVSARGSRPLSRRAGASRVLSIVSERYDEMWTAAKGLYKLEPIIADGGEITLWAPHVHVR